MNLQVKTKLNLLPFGTINYQSVGPNPSEAEQLRKTPTYKVPLTTDTESMEFHFTDETFPVPAEPQENLP